MKLIDKSAVVTEIKGYISNYKEIVAKTNRNDSTWVDSVSIIDAKIDVLQHVLFFLDTLKVKEVDLEKEFNNYAKNILACDVQFEPFTHLYKCAKYFYELGINAKNLWKSADGDDLPELKREVVVFTQDFPNDAGIMKVGIAHRPDPKGWDGRNILTGKVEHFVPKTYGKGGWSLPDVKIWLDCKLPFKEGGEE